MASLIALTPASSAKIPSASVGMPPSKLMLRCSYLAWSVPEANLVACDEKMLMAMCAGLGLDAVAV